MELLIDKIGRAWRVTGDRWQVTGDVTHERFQVTNNRLYVTQDIGQLKTKTEKI